MKKLLTIILILVMLLPAASLAETQTVAPAKYKPALGMTIETFINKYNAVAAPLGSPYMMLDQPFSWTAENGYNFAWFLPVKDSSVLIALATKEQGTAHVLTGGLDMVEILIQKDADFLDMISVTARCTDIFSAYFFNMSFGEYSITHLMRFLFEAGYKETQGSAYLTINEDSHISLEFCHSADSYWFLILPTEDLT